MLCLPCLPWPHIIAFRSKPSDCGFAVCSLDDWSGGAPAVLPPVGGSSPLRCWALFQIGLEEEGAKYSHTSSGSQLWNNEWDALMEVCALWVSNVFANDKFEIFLWWMNRSFILHIYAIWNNIKLGNVANHIILSVLFSWCWEKIYN